MPTPKAGDIACAASPMQSAPGTDHWVSRSICTERSLISSQSVTRSSTRVSRGTAEATSARKAGRPAS